MVYESIDIPPPPLAPNQCSTPPSPSQWEWGVSTSKSASTGRPVSLNRHLSVCPCLHGNQHFLQAVHISGDVCTIHFSLTKLRDLFKCHMSHKDTIDHLKNTSSFLAPSQAFLASILGTIPLMSKSVGTVSANRLCGSWMLDPADVTTGIPTRKTCEERLSVLFFAERRNIFVLQAHITLSRCFGLTCVLLTIPL